MIHASGMQVWTGNQDRAPARYKIRCLSERAAGLLNRWEQEADENGDDPVVVRNLPSGAAGTADLYALHRAGFQILHCVPYESREIIWAGMELCAGHRINAVVLH